MRRNKRKKLEVRQRRINDTDPIEELRRLREQELKHARGGCQEFYVVHGCT